MSKKLYIIILFIFIVIVVFLSQKEKLTYSFYHWESNFKQKDIKEKLYIKVLDISYSNKFEIIKTTFLQKAPKDFVPIIYITNDTLKKVNYETLSKSILSYISSLESKELQIDCDWTLSTKSKYFKLLENLKEKLNKTLSATIRLHQIKYYHKTGIPPVDYGVLMYYNMSDIANFDTKNSILDNSIARKYHYNFDTYKLKLKLALPLYSQAIQFRHKKALSIFEGVKKSDFDKRYFKYLDTNKYKVIKSTYFKGRYVYKNDIFRFEDSHYKDIKLALKDFLSLTNNRFSEVILYTLKYKDKYNLKDLIRK